jgi:hypothetical protein
MPFYFYGVSVFLSAFLLFLIQPMIGKFLLPWFGGTPTVWSTILLFSQVVLTAGYAYSYLLLGRLRSRWQGVVQLVMLGISLLLLLLAAFAWPSPLTPDASWRTLGGGQPLLDILRILAVVIGVQFLLLAANSTLMQAWFHRDYPEPTPYRLYALSNTGSLLALISYPILFEPNLTLRTQAYFWTIGYVLFAGTAVYLGVRTFRQTRAESASKRTATTEGGERPAKSLYLLWIGLAGCATILLVSMTSQITQEVAVVPFLWVLPLSIYLLTFILAFAGGILYSRNVYLVAFFVAAIGSRMLLNVPSANAGMQIFVFSLLLFIGCMLCHNELYKLRPDAAYLPSFYLMVALGGAVGGIFVTLIAPMLFSTGFWELQWGLILVGILMVIIIQREPGKPIRKRKRKGKESGKEAKSGRKIRPIVIGLAVIVLLQTIYVVYYMREVSVETELAMRNFYGILRVWELNEDRPELLANQLTHGRTAHGFQFENDDFRVLPTTYFTPESGVGVALMNHPKRGRGLRVGGLGLGIGIIGAYGMEEDVYRFYEVNPDVIKIAEGEGDYFSFLSDSEADIEVIQGDARVALEEELLADGSQNFDLLVIDTFSGDTIPLHLLTKEAFEIYLAHLNEGGIMAINVSNRLFDLPVAIFKLAEAFDLNAALIEGKGDGIQSYDSVWMLLTSDPVFLKLPFIANRTVEGPPVEEDFRLWTDDFSNLFQILK